MEKLMDRPFPALAALVAVLLFAASWLATWGIRGPGAKPLCRSAVSADSVGRDARATAVAGPGMRPDKARPSSRAVPAPIDWLPSLSDVTRSTLVGFSLGKQEESADVADQEPAREPAGPELLARMDAADAASEAAGRDRMDAVSADVQTSGRDKSEVGTKRPDESGHYERGEAPGLKAVEEQPDLLLMPTYDPRCRSEELELIAQEADAHARHGFELAGRKAYFSARAEFVMALRLLAQGLDAQYHAKAHSRSLAAGLTALSEAEDFMPRGSDLEADLDLAAIVRGHRTPVFHDVPCGELTTLDALESYLTFAQQQLGFSAGGEVAGSMALYGLGKLHKTLAEEATAGVRAARPKAVVFYQAALLVSPRNYMASNDLGVLLAQSGRYDDARAALEHSVSICGTLSGWQNLTVVYRELGRTEAARRATRLAEAAIHGQPAGPQAALSAVEWVDASTFARAAAEMVPGQVAPPVAPRAISGGDSPIVAARKSAISERGNPIVAARKLGQSPDYSSPAAGSAAPPAPPKQAAGWQLWKMLDVRR